MSASTHLSFPANYLCEMLEELPGGGQLPRHFFPADRPGGQDGLLVRVAPKDGPTWIGMFAFGASGGGGISQVHSFPDPEKLCVVSRGAGYIVRARDPWSSETVKAIPIVDVRAVASDEILVFANLTEMVAYGRDGVKWRTKRLAWDGFKIVEVTDRSIHGEYWDIRSEEMQRFAVDVHSGVQHGGVED